MVMTIAKITGNGYEYLLQHIARGDVDPPARGQDPAAYYTAAGNPPGRWTGRGASQLGLKEGQEVTEDQMRALFGMGAHPGADAMIDAYIGQHLHPEMTGRQRSKVIDDAIRHATLGRPFPDYDPSAKRTAVAGFDLVFSPVKSAALLWAVDDRPQVRDAIKAAHQQAVKEALEFIEEHAAHTRTGKNGVAQIDTRGLTAAAFEHWDSRAGDPNLHTHVAVSSKIQGTDGQWRSLDARGLYRLTVAASELYNTAFETHLTSTLGVTFTARPGTPHGKEPVREITGIPAEMTAFFSRRRAAIEAKYAELARDYRVNHGHDPDLAASHKLARQATLATRAGKKPPVTLAAKRARWREELTAHFCPEAIENLRQAVPGEVHDQVRPVAPDLDDLAERIVATVSSRRSTWTRWNIHAEAERLLRTELPGIAPDQHRSLAEQLVALALSPKHSISTGAPALLNEPPGLRRANGESVFTQHGAGRFTSQAVLDAERRLLTAARTTTASGLPTARTGAALDGFEAITGTSLDPGQRSLVTAFAADDRLLLAGIGPAGAGKTTAMRAYAHVLRQAGRRLIPLATSAASADVLGTELSLPAENLHKFAYEQARSRDARFAVHPGDVLLIDEAGMAGTFLLDQLVAVATANGATVRLLGDHRQLSAVESGGALRLLASEPGTPELTILHRFRDPQEAAVTLQLRTGDPAALDWYESSDRIRSGSRDAMTTAAYEGWKTDMLAGKTTMMAAGDGAVVTELSARARADRVTAGQVEPGGVTLRDGNRAGAGDWIVTRQNDRRLPACGGRDFVKNGDSWTVEARHGNGTLTVKSMNHGGRVTLPAAYVKEHVQLLYASTAHRVQGGTVDTAHPLITPAMTRETLYVLATRARETTTFYVATHDMPFDDDARVDQAGTAPDACAAREILTGILAREGAAIPATETIATAQEETESLATLVPRYLHATRQHAERRGHASASGGLTTYLNDAENLIAARITDLADRAIRERPAWMTQLGQQPANPTRREEWRHHVAVIAAYRDQYQITTDDPRQPLGPYPEPDPDHAGRTPYRHAAESVLAIRQLTGLDHATRNHDRAESSTPIAPPIMPPPYPGPHPSDPVPRM